MSKTCAFQPETVEALASAFQKSWQFLSRDPHFTAIGKAALQHQLSLCLLELAADGEHDPLALANGAICRLRSRMHSARTNDEQPRDGAST
jgi:hypothetical protein